MPQLTLFRDRESDYTGHRSSKGNLIKVPTGYLGIPNCRCHCGKPIEPSNTRPRLWCAVCRARRELDQHNEWKHRNRESGRALGKRHRERHPQRSNCRNRYREALTKSYLSPPLTCLKCGSHHDLQAHHPDYRYAYRTVPLCRACHAEHHRAVRAREINEYPIPCIKPQWTEAGAAWAEGNAAHGRRTHSPTPKEG